MLRLVTRSCFPPPTVRVPSHPHGVCITITSLYSIAWQVTGLTSIASVVRSPPIDRAIAVLRYESPDCSYWMRRSWVGERQDAAVVGALDAEDYVTALVDYVEC